MSAPERPQDGETPASLVPVPKVVAGSVTGALAVLVVWVAGQFGLDVPDYVAAAFTLLLTSGAAYWKSAR